MQFSIVIGWWLLPTIVSIASLLWASLTPSRDTGGDYSFDFMPAIRAGFALIISLLCWLIWALLIIALA